MELRILGLSDNEIQRLSTELSNLVNLVEFDISRNGKDSVHEFNLKCYIMCVINVGVTLGCNYMTLQTCYF